MCDRARKNARSLVLWFGAVARWFYKNATVLAWLGKAIDRFERWKKGKAQASTMPPFDLTSRRPGVIGQELYVLLLVAVMGGALVSWGRLGTVMRWAAGILAFVVLYEQALIMIKDVAYRPDTKHDRLGPIFEVQRVTRWALMALLSVAQIVLAFAVLIRWNAAQFWVARPGVGVDCTLAEVGRPSVTSLYQSFLTLTTLGFGDIQPTCALAELLVIAELSFFVMLVLLKLPIAVGGIRVRQWEPPPPESEKFRPET